MSATIQERPTILPTRQLTDYYCKSCGMFLSSSDAPAGSRLRVKCYSKRCKGALREIVAGQRRESLTG